MTKLIINARQKRDADLDQAASQGPYRIIERISLPKTGPKFYAWITGKRGHNGYRLAGPLKSRHITGVKTVMDLIQRDAIVNPEKFSN